ncbi:MAG: T9SS type A sorting domain-containing protein [Bacteroidota bacterium]
MKQIATYLSLTFAILFLSVPHAEAQWTQGSLAETIFCFTTAPNGTGGTYLFAGTAGSGIYRSANNGNSWTACNSGLTDYPNFTVRAFAVSGSELYAGTYGGGVFLSNNNGASWTAVNYGLTNLGVFTVVVFGSNIVAGTYGGGVYFSNNNGASWTAMNTGLASLNIQTLAVCGTDLYVGTTSAAVYRLASNGSSWVPFSSGLGTTYTVFELTAFGTKLFAATNFGVYLSTNGGAWKPRNTGIPAFVFAQAFEKSGSNFFVGTQASGVYISTDSGKNWTAVNTGLTNTWIRALIVKGNKLHAATQGDGLWSRPLAQMPKDISSEYIPEQISLHQNYPNPFNPTTTITYSLPEDGLVKLRVFDSYGRVVSELENGTMPAGTYNVAFDARSLPSGTYFYRLETKEQILTRSMLLMK